MITLTSKPTNAFTKLFATQERFTDAGNCTPVFTSPRGLQVTRRDEYVRGCVYSGGGGGCPGWFLKSTCYRLLRSFPKAAAASKIDKNTSLCNPDVRLGGERGCWLNKIILFTSFWDALKSKTDTRINVFWRQGTQIEDFLSLSSSFSNTRYQLFC